jgi:hypothetical protein
MLFQRVSRSRAQTWLAAAPFIQIGAETVRYEHFWHRATRDQLYNSMFRIARRPLCLIRRPQFKRLTRRLSMKHQGSVAFPGSRRAEAISIPTLDRAAIIDDGWDGEGAVEDLPRGRFAKCSHSQFRRPAWDKRGLTTEIPSGTADLTSRGDGERHAADHRRIYELLQTIKDRMAR